MMIAPTSGISWIQNHQPEWSVSCSRRTVTDNDGRKFTSAEPTNITRPIPANRVMHPTATISR